MANINFTSMLRTTAADGKLAETDQLYDPTQKKFQKDINADMLSKIEALTGVYRYKGSVSTTKYLPKSPQNGWVYNVAEDGMNYAAIVNKGYQDTNNTITSPVISSYKYSDNAGDYYSPYVVGKDSNGKELAVLLHDHADYVLNFRSMGSGGCEINYVDYIEALGFKSRDEFLEYLSRQTINSSGIYRVDDNGQTADIVTLREVSVVTWDALGATNSTDLSDYYKKSEVDQKISDASANMTWQ